MSALGEIGVLKAFRFFWTSLAMVVFRCLLFPPFRALFLRLMGSRIGPKTVVMSLNLINLYRLGFRGLRTGHHCYIGNDVKLDLAQAVELGDHVTLAENAIVLTHLNVGFQDHALQEPFPSMAAPVRIGSHAFIGAGAIILPGVELAERVFVAAGSVVTKSFGPGEVVAGNPAAVVRSLDDPES